MKKVFKSLMVGALAIPCAFAFTGCGDNGVNVNTSGNYKAVEATAAYAEIDNLQNDGALNFEGIKFTISQKVSGQNAAGDIRLDGTATYKGNNEVEFAIKVNIKASAAGINFDNNMSLYMKEKVLYIQTGEMKLKVDTTTTTDPDLSDYAQYLAMIPTDETIANALNSIQEVISVSEKSDVNGVIKYHFKGEGEYTNGTEEYWLIIKEGKFDGFKGTTEMNSQEGTMTGSANIVRYNDAVEFPPFDGFVDMGM